MEILNTLKKLKIIIRNNTFLKILGLMNFESSTIPTYLKNYGYLAYFLRIFCIM